jgi:hypothetical protein
MALLDRLLFWTAQRRGYEIVEPKADSDPIPQQPMSPELINAKLLLQRKMEHVDAMAESCGLHMPSRGENTHVDFR